MATTETAAAVDDDAVSVFREPEDVVRPGDIVRLSPSFRALKTLEHLDRRETFHNKRNTAARLPMAEAPDDVRTGKADARLVVESKLEWALLVTRGCDVDHGKERQLVLLRSLGEFQANHRGPIIDGDRVGLHFIPAPENDKWTIGDRVADFRFVVTVHRDLFNALERPISLTRDALLDLYFSWMHHAIGKRIPDTAPCPKCNTLVPVFKAVEEVATPGEDY